MKFIKSDYLDDLPSLKDSVTRSLVDKYNQLLIDNNMNPDDYEPEISFETVGNETRIIATPVPCQTLNGIKHKLRTRLNDK